MRSLMLRFNQDNACRSYALRENGVNYVDTGSGRDRGNYSNRRRAETGTTAIIEP
jgi:hypothetical protein